MSVSTATVFVGKIGNEKDSRPLRFPRTHRSEGLGWGECWLIWGNGSIGAEFCRGCFPRDRCLPGHKWKTW